MVAAWGEFLAELLRIERTLWQSNARVYHHTYRIGIGFISPAPRSITTGSMRLSPGTSRSLRTNARVASTWHVGAWTPAFDADVPPLGAHPQAMARTAGPPG